VTAGLFAGHVSERVGQRVVEVRRAAAERLVQQYCIAKGVAVAVNPVPVADLLAAAALDAGLVFHLSRLYGLPLSRAEAGSLVTVIATQMTLLMGTVWLTHFVSATLKAGTGGLSTVLTAGAQGGVAYYGTYMIGRVAERYFAQGKSWGEGGPEGRGAGDPRVGGPRLRAGAGATGPGGPPAMRRRMSPEEKVRLRRCAFLRGG
jgi:GTPase